mgnify:CR=1 FL=1
MSAVWSIHAVASWEEVTTLFIKPTRLGSTLFRDTEFKGVG